MKIVYVSSLHLFDFTWCSVAFLNSQKWRFGSTWWFLCSMWIFRGVTTSTAVKTANITSSFPLLQRTLQQISHRNGDIFLFHSNMAERRVSAFGQFEGENSKHKNYACHLLTYHPVYRIQQEYPPENHHISHPSRHFFESKIFLFQLPVGGRCIRPLERSSSQT